jgi:transposase
MGYPIAEKNHFISLLLAGKDVKTIKEEDMAHVNLATLHRWKKQAKTEGHLVAKKSTGRPPKFNNREIRHFIRVAKTNKDLSIKKIAETATLDATHKTLAKILKAHKLQSFPMLKKPKLTEDHKRKRLQWAQQMRFKTLQFWRNWTFSDECSVWLDCSEGIRRVVIERKDRHLTENCIGRKQGGGGKLMIWSFIFWDGRGPMLFLRGGVDQEVYKDILRNQVLPHCVEMLDENGVAQTFMDDGASCHDAQSVIDYCATVGIQRPYWPPNSPDMNPIEYIWGWIKHYLTNLKPVPGSLAEVEAAVIEFYEKIDYQSIRALFHSMTARVSALLEARGGNTKY